MYNNSKPADHLTFKEVAYLQQLASYPGARLAFGLLALSLIFIVYPVLFAILFFR